MRDKHTHNAGDSKLLKLIYKTVDDELVINKEQTTKKIWKKFIFYFFLTSISYLSILNVQSTPLFILTFILYGFISMLFAFNFAHDFSHNTIFKSKRWNNFSYSVLYTMMGAHAQAWKQRHIQSHHYAPNVEEYDSDLQISKLIRVIPNSEHFWWHRFQHLYAPIAYTTYSLFWVFVKDFVILFSKDEYTKHKGFTYHLMFWFQKSLYVTYLLILPLLFTVHAWYIVVLAFLMMHLSQSLFLLFTFFITHHVEETEYPTTNKQGYINMSWLMNQVKSSNDIHPFSESANFVFGGFNNHIAHHLFPHVHHIHYPALNKILYRVLPEHCIKPNQTSYFGGIASHLRLLKKMSRSTLGELIHEV